MSTAQHNALHGKTLEQIRASLAELGRHHPVLATKISAAHGQGIPPADTAAAGQPLTCRPC